MDLPDRGKACPVIKLVYIYAGGELLRIGPRYLIKHYVSTYNEYQIKVHGYSVRGNQQVVELNVEIEITDNNLEHTLHGEIAKFLI